MSKQDFFQWKYPPNPFNTWEKWFRMYHYDKKSKVISYLPTARYIYDKEKIYLDVKKYEECLKEGITLRPLQEEILNILYRRATEFGYNAWLIVAKTASGKTLMALMLASMFPNHKVVIACHDKITTKQMQEAAKNFIHEEVGIYYSEKKNIQRITATTHNAIRDKLDELKPDILIYDECDKNLSQKMIQSICKSNIIGMYGLTGTPYLSDLFTKDPSTEPLERVFGKKVDVYDEGDEEGEEPKIKAYAYVPVITQLRYRWSQQHDYNAENWAKLRESAMKDPERQKCQIDEIKKTYSKHKTSLILTERKEEAKIYFDLLTKENIPTAIITGDTKIDSDMKEIARIVAEPHGIIIGTSKLFRGADIPTIDSVFLFAPIKKINTIIQQIGRAMRPLPGKESVHIYDWNDYNILKNQGYERKKIYLREYKVEDIIISDIWEPPKRSNPFLGTKTSKIKAGNVEMKLSFSDV